MILWRQLTLYSRNPIQNISAPLSRDADIAFIWNAAHQPQMTINTFKNAKSYQWQSWHTHRHTHTHANAISIFQMLVCAVYAHFWNPTLSALPGWGMLCTGVDLWKRLPAHGARTAFLKCLKRWAFTVSNASSTRPPLRLERCHCRGGSDHTSIF